MVHGNISNLKKNGQGGGGGGRTASESRQQKNVSFTWTLRNFTMK